MYGSQHVCVYVSLSDVCVWVDRVCASACACVCPVLVRVWVCATVWVGRELCVPHAYMHGDTRPGWREQQPKFS